MEATTKCS